MNAPHVVPGGLIEEKEGEGERGRGKGRGGGKGGRVGVGKAMGRGGGERGRGRGGRVGEKWGQALEKQYVGTEVGMETDSSDRPPADKQEKELKNE